MLKGIRQKFCLKDFFTNGHAGSNVIFSKVSSFPSNGCLVEFEGEFIKRLTFEWQPDIDRPELFLRLSLNVKNASVFFCFSLIYGLVSIYWPKGDQSLSVKISHLNSTAIGLVETVDGISKYLSLFLFSRGRGDHFCPEGLIGDPDL